MGTAGVAVRLAPTPTSTRGRSAWAAPSSWDFYIILPAVARPRCQRETSWTQIPVIQTWMRPCSAPAAA